MTTSLYDDIKSSSGRLSTLAAALGSQLPGISFFIGLAPPGFRAITLLTSGGTLALFLLVFRKRETVSDCVPRGARSVAIAIALAVIYGFVFPQVTVGAPAARHERVRYQIGFGISPFSLTADAGRIASEQHLQTKEDLMLAFGAYEDGSTSRIWKIWSIAATGSLLCILFVGTYVYWTSGLAWLACALKRTG
jgi:hypothetical protein